jgi:hypothetical protein
MSGGPRVLDFTLINVAFPEFRSLWVITPVYGPVWLDIIIVLLVDVKELSQRCVGGQELQQQRQKIQFLADETNISLKKNVYQNYMQFIETAKEISRILLVFILNEIFS